MKEYKIKSDHKISYGFVDNRGAYVCFDKFNEDKLDKGDLNLGSYLLFRLIVLINNILDQVKYLI
jgi:hypothetical protein